MMDRLPEESMDGAAEICFERVQKCDCFLL